MHIIYMSDSTANASSGILWFFIITSLYSIVKYTTGESASSQKMYLGIYVLLLIIGEYFINLSLTNSICGATQFSTAGVITLVPWVIIFGLLNLLLMMFPSWLTPFSNTFGYGAAKLAGVTDLVTKIFLPENQAPNLKNSGTDKALAYIYSDRSLLINEITTENFDEFWQSMQPLMEKTASQFKTQLYDIIRLKTIVAEYIWYMLSGILVTSVGYNYLINYGCESSASQMKERMQKYEKEETEKIKNSENDGGDSRRIYKSQ